METCLYEFGLWACLWSIIWTVLTNVGQFFLNMAALLVATHIKGQERRKLLLLAGLPFILTTEFI